MKKEPEIVHTVAGEAAPKLEVFPELADNVIGWISDAAYPRLLEVMTLLIRHFIAEPCQSAEGKRSITTLRLSGPEWTPLAGATGVPVAQL